jgi:threonine/homoserine/homoserine lactone efflux protein
VPVALATFSLAAIMIVLLPGPDFMVAVRGLLRGPRQGVLTVLGVQCGLAAWVCAAAFGLSAVLKASQIAYDVLKIAGALYLIYLGVQSWRAVLRRRADPDAPVAALARTGRLSSGFVAGLLTDLLNPKVGVFFVSFLPGFIPHGYSVGWTTLLFGAVFVAINSVYFAGILLLGTRLTRLVQGQRARRRMDAVTGTVLVGFGLRLAAESWR